MTGAKGRRRREVYIAGGVLALHAIVLAPLALREASTHETAVPTVFDITLERPPRPVRSNEFAASDTRMLVPARATVEQTEPRTKPLDPTPVASSAGAAGDPLNGAGETASPGAAIARAMRLNGDCRRLIDSAERASCEARRLDRTVNSDRTMRRPEDSAFAAEGQRALADYNRRRAPLRPNSRAVPCAHEGDIMGRCDFRVETRVWSSRDGLLPDIQRRD